MLEPSLTYVQMLADLFSETVVKTLTTRLLEESREEIGEEITHSQYLAMNYLYSHGKCAVGHLSEGLKISYPASTKLVTRLAEKKLVSRTEGIADRRQAEVDLTPYGREIIHRLREARMERFQAILGRLSSSDRAALVRGLERFIVTAIEDEGVAFDICLRCGTDRLQECPVNSVHLEILGPSMIPLEKTG